MTEEEIVAFATKYDPQHFHLDNDAAKASLFGGLCANGWHTAAMFMRMLVDGMPADSGSLSSPGINNLRWLKPVYPGHQLRVQGKVIQCRLSESEPGVGIICVAYQVLNQHQDIVMALESNAFFRCKGKD